MAGSMLPATKLAEKTIVQFREREPDSPERSSLGDDYHEPKFEINRRRRKSAICNVFQHFACKIPLNGDYRKAHHLDHAEIKGVSESRALELKMLEYVVPFRESADRSRALCVAAVMLKGVYDETKI